MNDDRFDHELRSALLRDDPGLMREGLRTRVAAVPDEVVRHRRLVRMPRVSGWVASLEAIAAVAVVGALIVAALSLRGPNVGPAASGSPSVTPGTRATPSASLASPSGSVATPSVTPAPSPTSAVETPAAGDWAGLRWSAPQTFPDGGFFQRIVSWNGALIAEGSVHESGQEIVALWRSSDGTTWTRIGVDATAFADSQIDELLATPTGLVAWGTDGQPVCNGQGEGMTCGLMPVMFWTSTDATTWTRIADVSTFAGATIAGVTAGADGIVAVGDTGWSEPTIWVSATGSAWQRLTLPSDTFKDAHFSSVRASATGYVLGGAIGGQSPASGGVAVESTAVAASWWSADGRTWTKGTVNRAGGAGTSLGSIFVGADGMVAVGSASGGKSGTAWVSVDGRTWQPVANAALSAGAPTAPGVAFVPSFSISDDGTHLFAVGTAATGNGTIWISSDGSSWRHLPASGATATAPSEIIAAYPVPGGLIVLGQPSGSTQQFWNATALP